MSGDTPGKWRGHMIDHNGQRWDYVIDGMPVEDEPQRPCGHCGMESTPEGHDGCLGTLPGVMNACCGHGSPDEAYIQFNPTTHIHGAPALCVFKMLGVGPKDPEPSP